MNIPSLSGRIIAFERGSKFKTDRDSPREANSGRESNRRRHHAVHGQLWGPGAVLNGSSEGHIASEISRNLASLSVAQLQQAHYVVQQEITQSYFSLLWQELQRQLSVLLLQQSQIPANTSEAAPAAPEPATSPQSEILDLAAMLHQQQVQQQLMAAQFISAAFVQPTSTLEQQTVVREVNELQQQQLSNLTYQIIALVAANLEQQNQHPYMPETPMIHRILVKYMIALVLLQLQQQQHNLEFLRQERLVALTLIHPVSGRDSSDDSSSSVPGAMNALQMQQLLSEAAMLSLSRAHQLLCEAAILIPEAANQHPPNQFTHRPSHGTPPPPPFPGANFSQGRHSPRTTAAR